MTYTVLSVAPNPRSYDANGPKLAYKVRFAEHADKDVEWRQKADTAAPTPGQQVDGNIDWNARYGPLFTREYQDKGSNSAGGGGGSTWKPRDPKDTAAIQRQHSQEMALRYLAIQQSRGKVNDAFTLDGLKAIVDWFELDIQNAPQVYGEELKRKDSEQTGQSDVPPPAEGEFVHRPAQENEMWAAT